MALDTAPLRQTLASRAFISKQVDIYDSALSLNISATILPVTWVRTFTTEQQGHRNYFTQLGTYKCVLSI